MSTFIKVFSFFKSHETIIMVVATMILALGASIQSCRANRWEKKHFVLEGKLAEQQKDQDKLYGEAAKKRAERNLERAAEKEKRKKLEARIQKFKRESERAKIALREEKRKTATLPPTELVTQINERIGNESSLTGAGLFLFTRLGANRTLDKFKDGEFYLSEYNRQLGIIKDYVGKETSFTTDLASCNEERVGNLVGWNDCRETLATAQTDIKALKKVGKASVWRGRKQGAFWTIVIGGGLKLLGVW